MKFSKIRLSKEHEVSLSRVDQNHANMKDAIETSGVNPLPSLVDGVQAFLAFFFEAFPALKSEKDNLHVSTITLSEKDGDRTLQVSATLTVEHCNGSGVSVTTPLVRTPPEGATDGQLCLRPIHLKMIENVEEEATRYANGETAQEEMFAEKSENAEAVADRMSAESAGATRKRGRGKKQGEVVANIGAAPAVH